VPANLQRFLPVLVLVFLLLFVLPAILHKKSSSKGPTAKTLSQETLSATNIVDRGELSFRAAHHAYTSRVADLIEGNRPLAKYLADGVVVQLDASTNGSTYYGQVASAVIGFVRVRTGTRLIASSCVVIKSGGGVACPAPPAAKTTTATTSTTTTTTTAT
jgi:hypothetical protein